MNCKNFKTVVITQEIEVPIGDYCWNGNEEHVCQYFNWGNLTHSCLKGFLLPKKDFGHYPKKPDECLKL